MNSHIYQPGHRLFNMGFRKRPILYPNPALSKNLQNLYFIIQREKDNIYAVSKINILLLVDGIHDRM